MISLYFGLTNGGRGPKVVEQGQRSLFDLKVKNQALVARNYSIEWRRPSVDVAELVQKRYLKNWNLKKLSAHFGRSENSVRCIYQKQKRSRFSHKQIPQELRKQLLKATAQKKGLTYGRNKSV